MPPVSNSQITSPGFNPCPKAEQQITAAAKVEMRSFFIMPLKAEFYQSRGKIARGVSNPVFRGESLVTDNFGRRKSRN